MRKLFLIVITSTSLLYTACESNPDLSESQFEHHATIPGGCNGQDFNEKSASLEYSDTIILSRTEDTLNVFVGINYICCAPLTTSVEVENDSLLLEITDTCTNPYESCYCRCTCYYTFDFQFVNYQNREYSFQVVLDDPRESKPEIIFTGKVNPLP